MATDTTTDVARYLAIGGAHVTVTKTVRVIAGYNDEPETDIRFDTDCDACGKFIAEYVSDHRVVGYYRRDEADAEKHALEAAETTAADHAETCRRIPERLWPEDGAK